MRISTNTSWWLGLGLLPMACNPSHEATQTNKNQAPTETKAPAKPNIIFVMADDLGYGDLGCYGQKAFKTPNLDKMAAEGTRFTEVYAGSPVCAPSRSTLMTGQHTGQTTVRGNKSPIPVAKHISPNPDRVPLVKEDLTVAEMLKQNGYVTGMFGKWGLGEPGSEGEPNDQGFDQWLGFLNQHRAHDHFVDYFWHNKDTFWLEGNDAQYNHANNNFSHNVFTTYALNFIEANQDTTFFLYLPYCLPHDHFHLTQQDSGLFDNENWTDDEKIYATYVTKLDNDMGKLLKLLKKHNLDSNTMVFFCSDNGAARRWEGTFNSSGPLRGRKRDMYEGGIRVPMLVRMPGTVPANRVNNAPWYFPDVKPTLAALTQLPKPHNVTGQNMLPVITGQTNGDNNRWMYWEFHEGAFFQAARYQNWKLVRKGLNGKPELYNLGTDTAESNKIAHKHPEVVAKMEKYLTDQRTQSKYWNP